MSELVRTNVPGFYKNRVTGVVINQNKDQYMAIKSNKVRVKKNKQFESDIRILQKQVKELQDMVRKST